MGYCALFEIIQDHLKRNINENWLIPKGVDLFTGRRFLGE